MGSRPFMSHLKWSIFKLNGLWCQAVPDGAPSGRRDPRRGNDIILGIWRELWWGIFKRRGIILLCFIYILGGSTANKPRLSHARSHTPSHTLALFHSQSAWCQFSPMTNRMEEMPCRPAGGDVNKSRYVRRRLPPRTQEMMDASHWLLHVANLNPLFPPSKSQIAWARSHVYYHVIQLVKPPYCPYNLAEDGKNNFNSIWSSLPVRCLTAISKKAMSEFPTSTQSSLRIIISSHHPNHWFGSAQMFAGKMESVNVLWHTLGNIL